MACADKDSRTAADGSVACAPASIDSFQPVWSPPKSTSGACTTAQIDEDYAECSPDSPVHDLSACRDFEVAAENARCLACLYSVEGDATQGALVILGDGGLRPNVAGCIALVDGDASATGCGAKEWAFVRCNDAVCNHCAAETTSDCRTSSTIGVCADYALPAACATDAKYAACTDHALYADSFRAIGAIFCANALDAGGSEGGVR
jgi:hypothetical protein